ncbi:unnamed protein product [marine sediment metagenome]|uniref:Uncharacterized protein n=1 Tax=marine sediment metagenome TaxID=412755 RepID=X1HB64_9ZZZZ
MSIIWGIILIIISSLAYFGQAITAFRPGMATRLGLTEPEADVDPTFYADVRGEAFWDTAILWTLPAAGVLLLLDNPIWVYFGLVGGGMYLYFAGRGIVVRRTMQRNAIQIGSAETLKVGYIFLSIWGLTAIITIVMAIVAISNA